MKPQFSCKIPPCMSMKTLRTKLKLQKRIFLAKSSNGKNSAISKPQNHVHMPPELLVHVDVPLEVPKSFYLLPSLMYQMKSLMLVSQLRKKISFSSTNSESSFLILEAITAQRCSEDFSLKRLELLGDSILKYVVSCNLFLKNPEMNEGQLTSHRMKIINNDTLHKLGIERGIQGCIHDARTTPGHTSLHPVPCECGLDDNEVPNKIIYTDNDKAIVTGKACDKGNGCICSKTVSNCVKALIGAHYVDGGLPASIAFLKWLGIDAMIEPGMIEEAIRIASLRTNHPKNKEIETLETKIGYEFATKGLLLEAVTHAFGQESGVSFCYQRLEFLGDSVLDLLITWHLFQHHKDIDPGELTALRSASVNNNNFAQAAVKHKFQEYLQHASGLLLEQIEEYAKRLEDSSEDKYFLLLNGSSKAPKVLGDIVESIVGAMLIDTKLDLNKVWEIFLPLLSPIVTPDYLKLPPSRELKELCSYHGYILDLACTNDGDTMVATIEERGVLHSRYTFREKHGGGKNTNHELSMSKNYSSVEQLDKPKNVSDDLSKPVLLTVKMQKGGPRTALYELCKKCKWPTPSFKSTEWEPSNKVACQNFVSTVTVQIPNSAAIELEGEKGADKKSSKDSAAVTMLYELERRGRCLIAVS